MAPKKKIRLKELIEKEKRANLLKRQRSEFKGEEVARLSNF